MTDKQLSVRLHGEEIGILAQNSVGKMEFTYSPDAARPVSMSMPVRETPYDDVACEAVFGGLLPEGYDARRAIGKQFGVNANNSFSLLRAIGYDCAGAISFHPVSEPVEKADFRALDAKPLSDRKLAEYIRDLPRKPLFIGAEGMRLSLAGAQDKAAVCLLDDDRIALPQRCPTTHILKPAIDRLDATVQNEYLCMRIAARMQFRVPHVDIRRAEDYVYLLVERYDREVRPDGTVKRIHQEDFCQALGIVSAHKYEREGGPGLQACFDLLKKTTRPALDRNRLAEVVVFNYLIGNTDAHGKNFSLLHTDNGQTQLAPLYDVLCTRIYGELSGKMAMKLGGEYRMNGILPRHWQKLSEETGISYAHLRKIILRQTEALVAAAHEERALLKHTGFDTPEADTIVSHLEKQCLATANHFK